MLVSVEGVRVLLTEGSSLTSREVVSCLGPCGYHVEVLDPDPLCLGRFSRWVREIHRCPHAGTDPERYLETLGEIVVQRGIDVVLPTHEQAWLLAVARPLLASDVRVALADADAFARVQSKIAFAELLDELGLPQPSWRVVDSAADLVDLSFPYWLKAAFSTAGQGVREAVDRSTREAALSALLGEGGPVMAQQPATGQYGQVQGLFDRGRLLAVHSSVQRGIGVGGSAAARISVDHPAPREHIAALGAKLTWHGGLTLDYFHVHGSPQYIECNPRTVEPGNATTSGVNIPDLQARLTLGHQFGGPPRVGSAGVRTHGTIALLLGSASYGASRSSLLRSVTTALSRRGLYANSAEQLTPVLHDPPSLVPAALVSARLLLSPQKASDIARRTVSNYSIEPETIAKTAGLAAVGVAGPSS